MSHIDRSIANMRCEAKRIYNQRMYINKLEKDKKDLQQELNKYKSIVEMVKDELTKGITFCENDSQGHYDICNIAINREKKILEKIKELEEGNNNV